MGRSPYRSESLEAYGVTHTGSTMATATKTRLKVFPLADRVAIRPLEETEEMKGGLYIADTAKDKPNQGGDIAVGPGREGKGQRAPSEQKAGRRGHCGQDPGWNGRRADEWISL